MMSLHFGQSFAGQPCLQLQDSFAGRFGAACQPSADLRLQNVQGFGQLADAAMTGMTEGGDISQQGGQQGIGFAAHKVALIINELPYNPIQDHSYITDWFIFITFRNRVDRAKLPADRHLSQGSRLHGRFKDNLKNFAHNGRRTGFYRLPAVLTFGRFSDASAAASSSKAARSVPQRSAPLCICRRKV